MPEEKILPTVYTIGYQPMDLIDVRYRVIDLLNVVLSSKPPEQIDIRKDVIELLEKEHELFNDNYLLVNSKTNRAFLPYTASRKTILFDPPYVPHRAEVEHLLYRVQEVIGVKERMNKEMVATTVGTYTNSLNGMRNLVFQAQAFMPPASYYNALTLLSDMNSCSKADLQSYIQKSSGFKFDKLGDYRFCFYFGDPVNPEFFNELFKKGYLVVKYLPYEYYLQPCTDLYDYYTNNFLFQTPLFNTITIRNFLTELRSDGTAIDFCIINPGSLYLNREEAAYYIHSLKNDIEFRLVKGYNPSVSELGI